MNPIDRYRHSVHYLESLLTLDPDRRQTKLGSAEPGGQIGLSRCERLLEALGHPEQHLRFVHVTGTSGKGSVVTQVHRILLHAGVRVGSYLSPHVTTPLERIAVGSGLLPVDRWIDQVARLKPLIQAEYLEGPYGLPSYHELLFAMALSAFVELKIEVVVLEVGIGGTLDSTNVIPAPMVAVITDVGLDHTELLGSDVATIARDKAGIIKSGCVAITGAHRPEAWQEIQRRAAQLGVTLWSLERELRLAPSDAFGDGRFDLELPEGILSGLEVGMTGVHQQRNGALAAAVAIQLRAQGISIGDAALRAGLRDAFLPGRFEQVSLPNGHELVLDIAHNVDKVGGLVDTWLTIHGRGGAAVVAISADKDVDGILLALHRGFEHLVVTRPLAVQRKMVSPRALWQRARSLGLEAHLNLDPWEALEQAFTLGGGRVAVTGSTYLVGEVRQRYQSEGDILERGQVQRLEHPKT